MGIEIRYASNQRLLVRHKIYLAFLFILFLLPVLSLIFFFFLFSFFLFAGFVISCFLALLLFSLNKKRRTKDLEEQKEGDDQDLLIQSKESESNG